MPLNRLVAAAKPRTIIMMERVANIDVPTEKVADFCQRHGIRMLAFFGSVLRGDFRPDSDVDVLVEFEPGVSVGLIRLGSLQLELSSILGQRVDLRTPQDLSPYFRGDVVQSALVQYAQP